MVNVEFCNISMNLKFCQFKLFHNYLMNKMRDISSDTKEINLLLVRDNLNVTISLDDFIQLTHGVDVESVIKNIKQVCLIIDKRLSNN